MKNLMITAALVLGSLTATMAQETASISPAQDATETQKEVATQDYVAVDIKEVPKPVVDALAKDFKDAQVAKAWKNAKGEYKLELLTADKESMTVHANSKGEWIKKG